MITDLLTKHAAKLASMSETDRAAYLANEREQQRQSWARGMAPCEHGVADWETCVACRNGLLS